MSPGPSLDNVGTDTRIDDRCGRNSQCHLAAGFGAVINEIGAGSRDSVGKDWILLFGTAERLLNTLVHPHGDVLAIIVRGVPSHSRLYADAYASASAFVLTSAPCLINSACSLGTGTALGCTRSATAMAAATPAA